MRASGVTASVSRPVLQTALQRIDRQLDDLREVVFGERVEHDGVVEPVHELGPERLPHELHDLLTLVFVGQGRVDQNRRAQVRRQNQDDVLEVDGAPLAVGEAPVVHDLQQHVEHLGVRLLDLVEQYDTVRASAHSLGELTALLVPHVPGGAPTSRETECFSPYSDMSMRTIACSSSNKNSASVFASSVLPTPVGPRNRNEPVGGSGH